MNSPLNTADPRGLDGEKDPIACYLLVQQMYPITDPAFGPGQETGCEDFIDFGVGDVGGGDGCVGPCGPASPENPIDYCVSELFGLTTVSFTPSAPGVNGSFSALAPPGMGNVGGGDPYSFINITNDNTTYTLNTLQASCPQANPVMASMGCTDATNPFVNFTASDLTPYGTLFTQLTELGNSLAIITNSMPLSQIAARDQVNNPPGVDLANCVQP